MTRWRKPALGLAALTLLTDLALIVPPIRYGAAFALLWILPGLGWAALLTCLGSSSRPDAGKITMAELSTGLGLGACSVALLTLLLHYVPGPLPLPPLLLVVNLLTLTLAFSIRNSSFSTLHSPLSTLQSSFFILTATFFRLVHLGYSEFQGDEGIVMMRAARAITGDDAQLFYHQKGPIEVLLPMATWRLAGTINEWQARLPFAFIGVLGVVGVYLLGQRWFSRRAALISALLLAINGYFVGFGRIVQYQSFVLAMTALGLLALWRWSEGKGIHWLLVGEGMLAFGILGHYDALLALPAAAYVVGRRLWSARRDTKELLKPLGPLMGAAALAFGILALFYVPFALHPNFVKTLSYLSEARIGTGGPLYNNLLSSLPLAIFYNPAYYLISLVGLLIVASFLSFRRWGLLIPAACYTLSIHQPLTSNLQLPTWIGPVLACLLTAIILSQRTTATARAAWLWFGVPFLFYYFAVWDPRTHVLNAFPGAVLLAGLALDRFFEQLTAETLRRALIALFLAIFLFLAYHPYVMFVQHNPEVKRTWTEHRPGIYWWPDEMPRFGYFGFPYQAGWKVVGVLIEEGIISGTYASNEEQEVTDWYTHGAERTYCPDPDWYFIAKNVQDEVKIPKSEIEVDYHLWGEVQVEDETKLRIYHLRPPDGSPQVFQVQDYALRFDAHTTPENVLPSFPVDYTPAGYTLGGKVQLIGYRLDADDAHPGGSVGLVLYWKALQPLETNYQVFNHLYDGTMWGQKDGAPACASQPTVLWEPDRIVRDEYTIPVDPTAPTGKIPLLVGMYKLDDGERLLIRDRTGQPVGDAIPLAVVTVQ